MDQIDPRTTHFIHPMIDGENLTRERTGGPCPLHPSHFINGTVCLVVFIAIIAACWAADKAMGIPA